MMKRSSGQLNSQKSLRATLLAAQKRIDEREKRKEAAFAKKVVNKGNPSRSRQDPDPGL